jgi:acetyl-CoA carboxylase biotin carboxyl carrier protein
MDLDRIKALIDLLAGSPIGELDLTEDGHRIRLVKNTVSAQAPIAPPAGEATVTAPMFGIFHLTPSPGAPPFVAVGDSVETGQPLGTIEAMKVFHAITADQAGRVDAILVTAGQEVETGTPLFRIVP